MKNIFYIFLLASVWISCANESPEDKAQKMMGNWFKKKVILPDNVELINESFINSEDKVDLHQLNISNYYIFHYFDASCEKCINYLKNAQIFIKKQKRNRAVKYVFIADATNSYYVKKVTDSLKFKYPVYYEKDPNQLFLKNRFKIGDDLYSNFLINKNSELILFGSVFDNDKAKKIIYSIINK